MVITRQRPTGVKREQKLRDEQLGRLLDLVVVPLQTLLAGLNDMGHIHNVAITTTKPGDIERFQQRLYLSLRDKLHLQPVVVFQQ